MSRGNSFAAGGSEINLCHRRKRCNNCHRDNQIQALESRNEKNQHKILKLNKEIDDLIKIRYVPRRGYFDNVLCFITKNSKEVHPYYVIRCQYRQLEKYKRCLKLRYTNMEEVGICDDPNAIH